MNQIYLRMNVNQRRLTRPSKVRLAGYTTWSILLVVDLTYRCVISFIMPWVSFQQCFYAAKANLDCAGYEPLDWDVTCTCQDGKYYQLVSYLPIPINVLACCFLICAVQNVIVGKILHSLHVVSIWTLSLLWWGALHFSGRALFPTFTIWMLSITLGRLIMFLVTVFLPDTFSMIRKCIRYFDDVRRSNQSME